MEDQKKASFVVFLSLALAASCTKEGKPHKNDRSVLTNVNISSPQGIDYDEHTIVVSPDTGAPYRDTRPKSEGFDLRLKEGRYKITLIYLKDKKEVVSSLLCPPEDQVSQWHDVAGRSYTAEIIICPADGVAVPKDPEPPASCDAPDQHSPPLLRLLTRVEYQNSVKDLIGYDQDVTQSIPPETKTHGYHTMAETQAVTVDHLEAYLKGATQLADHMLKDRSSYFNCNAIDNTCLRQFLESFGTKIWRRPLSGQEISGLQTLYNGVANQGQDAALRTLLKAMWISPHFLYRSEIGEDTGDLRQLSPWEIASALSFMFWKTTPDDRLLQKARAGDLREPANIRIEAQRLLQNDRSRDMTADFASEWLEAYRILTVNKAGNFQIEHNLRGAFLKETKDFFNHVTFSGTGKFPELFNADYTFGNQQVANHYKGSLQGNRISLPTTERRGVLGHTSVLGSHSHAEETGPITRGVFIFDKILCDPLPSPPDSLDVQPPPIDENATTRERFAAHSENPSCKGCHIKIDGIGFGMEDMDPAGRFRTTEHGKPVDASGVINSRGIEQTFSGTTELASFIAESDIAAHCFVQQTMRYQYGRMDEGSDSCAVSNLQKKFSATHYSIKDLFLDLADSPQFLKRHKGP